MTKKHETGKQKGHFDGMDRASTAVRHIGAPPERVDEPPSSGHDPQKTQNQQLPQTGKKRGSR